MQHLSAFAFALLMVAAGTAVAADDAQRADLIFKNLCAQCHGAKGEGNPLIKSPSIASLPSWYVRAQLENFRGDRRGIHLQDPEGQLMRATSKAVDARDLDAIAEYISKLPRQKHEATIKADLAAGRELFEERCMECHRYNGEGELAFGAAALVGLQDWYLENQLKKFKSGMRGAKKDDANGQKMVLSARFIESEEMLKAVVAYILTLSQESKSNEIVFGQ